MGGLLAKPHPGKAAQLSVKQRKRLVEILLQGPMAAGFPTEMWTCPRVAQIIEREFEVSYHSGQVWKILRSLGWTLQKPQHRSRKRNEKEIEMWREREWPRIENRLKKGALSI
jgi:transposase